MVPDAASWRTGKPAGDGNRSNVQCLKCGWIDWSAPWAWPVSILIGIVLVIAMLHLARLVGHLHGKLAKTLLVSNRAW